MKYKVINYENNIRFNSQYNSVYNFLLKAGSMTFNEHYHWGRFEWMNLHSYLEEDKLSSIIIAVNENNEIEGMLLYDTTYDDRLYLIHHTNDIDLLNILIDEGIKIDKDNVTIKVNSKDVELEEVLDSRGFVKANKVLDVLELGLNKELNYEMPESFDLSLDNFFMDKWKYQLLIHKGFGNEGVPEKWTNELFFKEVNSNPYLRVFAYNKDEYCSHCGVWYTKGETAYIEPVVTAPDYRKRRLAKAVVYEACNRARSLGAKRAIVLSDMDFYYNLGFKISSEVYNWIKK